MKEYAWPGNVRELASVIDRAAILGDGKRLEVATALGIGVQATGAAGFANSNTAGQAGRQAEVGRGNQLSGAGSASVQGGAGSASSLPPPQTIVSLDAAMRVHIERALAAAGGRIEGPRGAAKLLQINPHTLRADAEVADRLGPFPPGPAGAGCSLGPAD